MSVRVVLYEELFLGSGSFHGIHGGDETRLYTQHRSVVGIPALDMTKTAK